MTGTTWSIFMRIVIAGGSGFLGVSLINRLQKSHHDVTLLTRSPEKARTFLETVRIEFWDAKTKDALPGILEGADAVINLTGESIAAKRWTQQQKDRILSSRIDSTRAIVDALGLTKHKPSVLLNASAVGFYGNVPEGEVTESSPNGDGFLAAVCARSEAEALRAQEEGLRVVLLRTGIVIDKNGGVLRKLLVPFRFFLGGPTGSGRQWFPWIHLQDEINAILYAMENDRLAGPLNLSAPGCVRMSEFCSAVGNILHRPSRVHVPGFFLKAALGEMAEPLLLHG
ncbi:MAG: TIGR01777 family protein, partial [Ignavibacteriae bacterium]